MSIYTDAQKIAKGGGGDVDAVTAAFGAGGLGDVHVHPFARLTLNGFALAEMGRLQTGTGTGSAAGTASDDGAAVASPTAQLMHIASWAAARIKRQSGSQQAPQSRSPITPLPKIKIRPTTVTASPTKVGSRFQQHMRQSSSHGKLPQQGKRRPETTSNSKLSLRTSSSSFGDDFY